MSNNKVGELIKYVTDSLQKEEFVRLLLADKKNKSDELAKVIATVVSLKKGFRLSLVYRYPTKDITKNYEFIEVAEIISDLLTKSFKQAELFTLTNNYHYSENLTGKSKIKIKPPTQQQVPDASHNKKKKRLINPEKNVYLKALGITNSYGMVKNNMQDKYRQINKYIEAVSPIIQTSALSEPISIVDMGSGKGYLTFALYDYLSSNLKYSPKIAGVEMRKQLVNDCNNIASEAGFDNLSFVEGNIETSELPFFNTLIALHACDTATDDAIFRGIQANASIIICAPCCHKQIRKELNPDARLKKITQFGILAERQAELLTDSIRALILQAYGYKTKVFEFISTEHTPKNVLITAVKNKEIKKPDPEILKEVENIKNLYGIKEHYLQKLLVSAKRL